MAKGKTPTPNDQRAVVKNPKAAAFSKDKANTANQVKANPVKAAPKPNDLRATVKNPTSKAYQVDKAHTAKQVTENKAKKGK